FRELLLEFKFFFDLGIKYGDYQERTAEYVEDFLRKAESHRLDSLSDEAYLDVLDHISNNIQRVYAHGSSSVEKIRESIVEAKAALDSEEPHPVKKKWDTVTRFFKRESGTRTPWQIVSSALSLDD